MVYRIHGLRSLGCASVSRPESAAFEGGHGMTFCLGQFVASDEDRTDGLRGFSCDVDGPGTSHLGPISPRCDQESPSTGAKCGLRVTSHGVLVTIAFPCRLARMPSGEGFEPIIDGRRIDLGAAKPMF